MGEKILPLVSVKVGGSRLSDLYGLLDPSRVFVSLIAQNLYLTQPLMWPVSATWSVVADFQLVSSDALRAALVAILLLSSLASFLCSSILVPTSLAVHQHKLCRIMECCKLYA